MTIAVALRASSTVRSRGGSGAAGGAGEEDHALGVAWDLVEGLDHLGLAAAGGAGERYRGPHAEVELGAERLDELALLLGDLGVALGDEHLAVAWLHAQELHRAAAVVVGGTRTCAIMAKRRG